MTFTVSRGSGIPLSRQIYSLFKEDILMGRLAANSPLPSTRALAATLGVSRNTVCEAYDMLLAEGFLKSRPGAPTRVAEGLFLEKPAPFKQPASIPKKPVAADFSTGKPDLRAFPIKQWLSCLNGAARALPVAEAGYTGPQGLAGLREEISRWMRRSRGIAAAPEDIFITGGATQALFLIAGVLAGGNKKAVVEDPCHSGMLKVLQNKGFEPCPAPVDGKGLITEGLKVKGASMVYVTPSHQFPLGGILPADRRAALIRLSRESGLYIVEDDYDSEFRYAGPPVSPLYSMDPQRVIYVGTFSKLLFPALRIGYVLLPKELNERWRQMKTYTDVQNPVFEQAALAEFIKTGRLERHLHAMRRLYGQRRRVLLTALREAFAGGLQVLGDAAGLHIAVKFKGLSFPEGFSGQAREYGIRISTGEFHAIRKGFHKDTLLLGYGHLDAEEIQKGVLLLKEFLTRSGYLPAQALFPPGASGKTGD